MIHQLRPPFRILRTCRGGGYSYAVTEPKHPRANSKGLYPLHRVLMENKLGRLLAPGEHVHHIDGNKRNDDPENLAVLTRSEHGKVHAHPAENVAFRCGYCGAQCQAERRRYHGRMKISKSGVLFCSHSCGAKHQYSRVRT